MATSQEAPKATRGRPPKAETASVYGKLPIAKYELLQSIREEKGWSLVTALVRAINALAEKEGRI